MTAGRGTISIEDRGIAELARSLTTMLERVVLDRTALAGAFDVQMQWSADPGVADDVPSIFTALQEQLGLRLESARETIEVLAIDRMERPIPD